MAGLLGAGLGFAQNPDTDDEALAEPEQQYLVEMLFFRHREDALGTQESWSPRPVEPEPEPEPEDAETTEATIEPEEIELTEEMLAAEEEKRRIAESLVRAPRNEFQLLELSSKLASSRNYEPIAHIGWTQPGYLLEIAPPFVIDTALAGQGTLIGTATFSKGRYLRLDVDVEYRPQGSLVPLVGREQNQLGAGLIDPITHEPMFYIVEQRRSIKSNETHYFDNPSFGIIARITPLLTEETEEGLSEPDTAGQ